MATLGEALEKATNDFRSSQKGTFIQFYSAIYESINNNFHQSLKN